MYFLTFFFQAEDGIRDLYVTGVQTCALPISRDLLPSPRDHDVGRCVAHEAEPRGVLEGGAGRHRPVPALGGVVVWLRLRRSEERRVGKEGGARVWRECYRGREARFRTIEGLE